MSRRRTLKDPNQKEFKIKTIETNLYSPDRESSIVLPNDTSGDQGE